MRILRFFMRHQNTMFASDSGIRRLNVDVPHPRGYGNSARLLGLYVREKKTLTLEDAVRKMTSLPAQVFRLKERGELREGNWRDLVVFDPETSRTMPPIKIRIITPQATGMYSSMGSP